MTITVNDTRDEYTATAGQTVFNYTFKIFEDTDLLVYKTASGATPDDATDLITAYTVTGAGAAAGGTIILTTGATLNDKITIVSAIPEKRTTDYQYNADFSADVVNDDLDRVVSLVKQLSTKVDRTPLFDNSVQSAAGVKWAAPTALEFIRWNAAADELESVSLNTAVGANNAAAISASTTTSGLAGTDVQAQLDELVMSSYTKTGTITFSSGGGVTGTLSYATLKVSSNSTRSNTLTNFGFQGHLNYQDTAATTRQAQIFYGNGNISAYLAGSTSGENVVIDLNRASGYLATVGSTGTQQKIAEWDTVAFKATKAFELPTYANLAAISAAITAPRAGMLCYVTGQGMAIYKASWVRTTDETTAIV